MVQDQSMASSVQSNKNDVISHQPIPLYEWKSSVPAWIAPDWKKCTYLIYFRGINLKCKRNASQCNMPAQCTRNANSLHRFCMLARHAREMQTLVCISAASLHFLLHLCKICKKMQMRNCIPLAFYPPETYKLGDCFCFAHVQCASHTPKQSVAYSILSGQVDCSSWRYSVR